MDEHLPDLVNAKSCSRASFWEETPSVLNQNPDHPRKFLALYQTDFEELLKSDEYQGGVRRTSELFEQENAQSKTNADNGDFDARYPSMNISCNIMLIQPRYYKLWQNYDPKGVGETLSPIIVMVYMNPQDVEDFEKWYREEHLDMLSKLPGYHRSLRYKIGPRTPLTQGETEPYLAIHFVNDVSAFESQEAADANATSGSIKHIQESKP